MRSQYLAPKHALLLMQSRMLLPEAAHRPVKTSLLYTLHCTTTRVHDSLKASHIGRVKDWYLKGPVKVVPDPIALDELYDSTARLQERRIGEVGGMDAYEYCCAGHDLQLLLERRCGIEFHNPHLHKAPNVQVLFRTRMAVRAGTELGQPLKNARCLTEAGALCTFQTPDETSTDLWR